MTAIERALADVTDWVYFESLCCRVLNSEGFKIDPRGGSGDSGRDAIEGDEVTFQYSLQEDAAKKLGKELKRYETADKHPKEYLFLSNQDVSADTKDKYTALFGELGIKLRVFDRAWLSGKIGADKLKHIRDELLATNIINAPDTVRFALSGPMRTPMLAALDEGTKGAITDERLGRVRALMKAQEFEAAEKLLREVLEQADLPNGHQFEARTHLGNVALQQGRIDEAKAEWSRAIATGHPNTIAAANLATTLMFCEGKNAEAQKVVDRALEVDPRSAGLANLTGLLKWMAGDTSRALELFRQAYSIEPRPEHLLNEWNLRSEAGAPPSDEDIEKALERYPTHKELLLLHANRLVDRFQEKHDSVLLHKALETMTRALSDFLPRIEKTRRRSAFAPLDWEWIGCALNTMAGLVYWTGDLARAEGLLQLATLFRDAPLLSFTLGQIQTARGRFSDAIASYEVAAKGGFDKPDLWLQLGNAHRMRFRETGDEAHIEKAAYCYDRASQTNPFALTNLAQLHWDFGSRDKARELAKKALEANPNEPVAQCNSLIYSCDGDPTRVLAGIGSIELEHPNDPTVLTVIGDSNYQLKEWARAYAYFARALKAAGNNAFLLEQAYPRAADALAKSIGGDEGRRKAETLLQEGVKRLPGSAAIAEKLREVSAKQS